MTHQARGEATRRGILSAAVEVFEEVGYGDASFTEIIDRAGVSKGACYYHFPTKAAVAAALVAESDAVVVAATRAVWDYSPQSNVLENLIRAAFVIADCASFDTIVRTGIHLVAALGDRGSERDRLEGTRGFLLDAVESAIAEGDMRGDVSAEDLGHALWVSLLGNLVLSEAAGEDLTAALARVLRTILPGVCTGGSAPLFQDVVDRLAGQHS